MIWLLSTLAWAENAVDIDVVRHGQLNTSTPVLIVKVRQPLTQIDVQFNCSGKSHTLRQSAQRGELTIPIEVPKGNHTCKGTLSIEMDDGSSGSMPLNFQATMHPELKMSIPEEKVDLQNGTLNVKLDRPSETYSISLFDSDNEPIGQGFERVDPAFNIGFTEVSWEAISDDLAVIQIQGKDIYGFTTETKLFPWSYDIPHEDVTFGSNESDIPVEEVYKLTDVQSEVQTVVAKYNQFAVVNLYVAGYTDTVGNPSHNKSLSEQRAKSIAIWFKQSGFEGNIYYQGFGESVLAVPTADGVDESQNRRVLYVVASTEPNKSSSFPTSTWKALR